MYFSSSFFISGERGGQNLPFPQLGKFLITPKLLGILAQNFVLMSTFLIQTSIKVFPKYFLGRGMAAG